MAKLYIREGYTEGDKDIIHHRELDAVLTDAGELKFESGKLLMKSATKLWRITVDDNGVLSTEEVV